jgi:hypothetical protein
MRELAAPRIAPVGSARKSAGLAEVQAAEDAKPRVRKKSVLPTQRHTHR